MHHPYCPLLHREVLFLLPWEPPRFPRYENGPSTKPLSKKICQVLHVSFQSGLCKRWLKGDQKCCSCLQSYLTDNCKHAEVCIGLNAGCIESECQQIFSHFPSLHWPQMVIFPSQHTHGHTHTSCLFPGLHLWPVLLIEGCE